MLLLLAMLAQWTSAADSHQPRVVLQGWWASCPEADGYTERAFEYKRGERVLWSIHMGPRDEFALFAGAVPDAHVDHADASNRLAPAYHYADLESRAGRNWTAFGAHLNVVLVPGGTGDCYEFYLKIEQDAPPVWAQRQ